MFRTAPAVGFRAGVGRIADVGSVECSVAVAEVEYNAPERPG